MTIRNPYSWLPRFPPQLWLNTSSGCLEKAERSILATLWDKLEHSFVYVHNKTRRMRTVSMNSDLDGVPLVLVHGMGAGVGLWVLNYEALAKDRPVYAFDMLGFGRSSRPTFHKDGAEAEREFVESIEEWRKEMQLEHFVLLGHSLGGYIASSYALKYPHRIRHLILADPWGFAGRPENKDNKRFQLPWYIKGLAYVISPFNPLAGLRVLGPVGPNAVNALRSDLVRKFSHLFEDQTVAQYIYHCNAQNPTGEAAFQTLSESFGWAKYPMAPRLEELPQHLPISIIYGSRSWMDATAGWQFKFARQHSYVDINIVPGAGHHVYLSKHFNLLVNRVCDVVDQNFDRVTLSPVGAYRRLRRYSESLEGNGNRAMGRRSMSECPPDSLADEQPTGFKPAQTFAVLGNFSEESVHDLPTSPLPTTSDVKAPMAVTFQLPNEKDGLE